MQIVFYFGVNKYETYKYFSTTFCVVESYTVLSHWAWQFLNTEISQASVG